MTVNRPIILLSASLMALTACVGDNEPALPGNEIQFEGIAEAGTSRASSAIDTGYNLWISAIYHNELGTGHDYYFAGSSHELQFSWNSIYSTWRCADGNQYYPTNGTMDFLAYATLNATHKPQATYIPATPNAANPTFTSLTLDFGTKLDATDPVIFSDMKKVSCVGNVPCQQLLLRNALSKIVFTLTTDSPEQYNRLTLHKLKVLDVRTSGVLQITPEYTTEVIIDAVSTSVGSEAQWTSLSGAQTSLYVPGVASSGVKIASTTPVAVGSPLYLPTQADDTIYIEIEYSIANGSSYTSTAHYFKTLALPSGKWLPEKQYTYTLNCNLTEIAVSVAATGSVIDDWTPVPVVSDEVYGTPYTL